MPASLRAASAADAELLARLAGAALPEAWPAREFASALERAETRALIAAPEQGFVLGRRTADEAEILALAVARDARGRGVGKALVEALVGALRAEGVRRVWLEVRGSNVAAQRLYAALGFAPAGRRERYYADGEDALVLGAGL